MLTLPALLTEHVNTIPSAMMSLGSQPQTFQGIWWLFRGRWWLNLEWADQEEGLPFDSWRTAVLSVAGSLRSSGLVITTKGVWRTGSRNSRAGLRGLQRNRVGTWTGHPRHCPSKLLRVWHEKSARWVCMLEVGPLFLAFWKCLNW